MITVVDRHGIRQVQKVTDRRGKLLRYQVVVEELADSSQVVVCATLTEARARLRPEGAMER